MNAPFQEEELPDLRDLEFVELGEAAAVVYLAPDDDDPRSHDFGGGARVLVGPGVVLILSPSIRLTADDEIEG